MRNIEMCGNKFLFASIVYKMKYFLVLFDTYTEIWLYERTAKKKRTIGIAKTYV